MRSCLQRAGSTPLSTGRSTAAQGLNRGGTDNAELPAETPGGTQEEKSAPERNRAIRDWVHISHTVPFFCSFSSIFSIILAFFSFFYLYKFDRFIGKRQFSSNEFLDSSFGKTNRVITDWIHHPISITISCWFTLANPFFATKSYTYPCHNYSSTFTPNGSPSANV